MKETTKKYLKIALDVLLWIFVAFSVLATVLAFTAQNSNDGVPTLGGKCFMSVLSESMDPTFKEGDMIIGTKLTMDEKANLNAGRLDSQTPGDIISFYTDLDGDGQKNEICTHRIVEIIYDSTGAVESYVTRGDNKQTNTKDDDYHVPYDKVIARWDGGTIPALGGFLNFLQEPKGFLVCIVLPLVLFFLYEVFVFIKTFMSIKNDGKKVISAADEELIKQKAIEEYLREQAAQTAAQASAPEEKPSEEEPKQD